MISRGNAIVLFALACTAGAAWATRDEGARPARAEALLLHMPFEAGVVVWLMQGNQAPSRHTHRQELPNNEYALDFATPLDHTVHVVAAAAGRVTFVFAGARADEPRDGSGYGNHVKVVHEGGLYTFYAHLDEVTVAAGEQVAAGQRLGTMGLTGAAGMRHLHFSLHGERPGALGGAPSVPITRLLTLDVTSGESAFRPWRGGDLRLDYQQQWRGHLYASENSLEGEPPSLERIRQDAERIQAALDTEVRIAAIADAEGADLAWLAGEIAAVKAADPDHPVILYLEAVALQMPAGAMKEAERSLLGAAEHNRVQRRHVPWLAGRVHFQLGRIERARGNHAEARRHFQRAIDLSTSKKQLQDARGELFDTPRG